MLAPTTEKARNLLPPLEIVELSFAKRSGWGPGLSTKMRARWAVPKEMRPGRWKVWFASWGWGWTRGEAIPCDVRRLGGREAGTNAAPWCLL